METCLKIYNDNVSIKVGTKKENGNVYFLAECKDEFSFINVELDKEALTELIDFLQNKRGKMDK